jgi:hypothetical protein
MLTHSTVTCPAENDSLQETPAHFSMPSGSRQQEADLVIPTEPSLSNLEPPRLSTAPPIQSGS